MSSKAGQVKVAGRFPAGEVVALVQVDGPHVLRAQGGKTIERKRVDSDGVVTFDKDIGVGDRFFVTGYVNGRPVEVRASGLTQEDASELKQSPVGYEPRKFADGTPIVDNPAAGDPAVPKNVLRLDPEDPAVDEDSKARAAAAVEESEPVAAKDLKGKALKDRAKELGVEKVSTKTAAQLRAAVARKEKAAA